MIWKPIYGDTLKAFIYNFNERFRRDMYNIDENNLKLSKIEISVLADEPPTTGKAIIYMDSVGNLKLKKPDGTIKTFTLT